MTLASPDIDVQDITTLDWKHEPYCEHSQHATIKRVHDDGPAKWLAVFTYAAVRNCKCTDKAEFYVCDKWAKYIQSGKPRLYCSVCAVTLSQEEMDAIRFYPLNA